MTPSDGDPIYLVLFVGWQGKWYTHGHYSHLPAARGQCTKLRRSGHRAEIAQVTGLEHIPHI